RRCYFIQAPPGPIMFLTGMLSRWQRLGFVGPPLAEDILTIDPVTTRPTVPWVATRRSAAATQRSFQGDMRYVLPHCSARRPWSRPALPRAPTAQAPAPSLLLRERHPGTLAPGRAIGAHAPAPRSGTGRRPADRPAR